MKRRAFTLVELITAISIIALLAGMVLLGVKHMTAKAKEQTTRVMLDSLKSMLAEYDSKTRLKVAPTGWYRPDTAALTWCSAGADFWTTPSPAGTEPIPSPAAVTTEFGNGGDRDASIAVMNTLMAMKALTSIPANNAALSKLPPQQLMTVSFTQGGVTYTGPILLDGWNNPIILVPASGLGRTIAPNNVPVVVAGNNAIIQAPTNRPFFASAGPDGSFKNGDDNLYSFEQ